MKVHSKSIKSKVHKVRKVDASVFDFKDFTTLRTL
jgi:hypothetical protein